MKTALECGFSGWPGPSRSPTFRIPKPFLIEFITASSKEANRLHSPGPTPGGTLQGDDPTVGFMCWASEAVAQEVELLAYRGTHSSLGTIGDSRNVTAPSSRVSTVAATFLRIW